MKPGIVIGFVAAVLCHAGLLFGLRMQQQARPLPISSEPSTVDVNLVEAPAEPAGTEPETAAAEPANAPSPSPEPAMPPEPMEMPAATPEPVSTPIPALQPLPAPTPEPTPEPIPEDTPKAAAAATPKHISEHAAATAVPSPKSKANTANHASKHIASEQARHAAENIGGHPGVTSGQGATGISGGTSAKPRYRSNPPPEYPATARLNHEQGVAMVSVEVSKEGRPTAVSLSRSCGFPDLDQAALQAVRHWLFDPALKAGIPVASQVVVPVHFSFR